MTKGFQDYGIDIGGRSGEEVKTPCPKCSHLRRKKSYPCLNVNTIKGVWHCWHCGWSGGLVQGEFAKPTVAHTKVYVKPDFRPTPLSEGGIEFFRKRGITNDVLMRNHCSLETIWMPQIEEEVTAIAFPYYRDGEVVNVKYRDKHKNFRQVGGAQKVFYKADDISEITIITEGEMDALSLEVAGFTNAISVPDGAPAPNTKNYETKFEYLDDSKLDAVKTFILAVDADEPGKKLEEELARRLGRERCKKVTYPEGCKDCNEVLLFHGKEILAQVIANAQPYPVEGVFSVHDIADGLDAIFNGGLPQGFSTGWRNVDELYQPAVGQWTLLTGIPSMGKSEWLDAMAINLAENTGWVFGVCSPENQPIDWHVAKLMEKRMQKRLIAGRVSQDEFTQAKDWMGQHFHFIMPEKPTIECVLEKARELVRRFGMKGLIIDPYNELEHTTRKEGISETEYVSTFLTTLRKFAREQSVHIWLVAHPAKMMRDNAGIYPVPDGYAVSGSAHFYNKADNIIAVHRDLTMSGASTQVHIQKIRSRWLGKRGVADLWWRPDCGRFDEVPQPYYPTADRSFP